MRIRDWSSDVCSSDRYLFAHRVMPISRRVQERKGDLTEASDEAVVGMEIVQAFGREPDVRERFGERAGPVRDVSLLQAGVEDRFLPGLIFVPTLRSEERRVGKECVRTGRCGWW